PSLLAVRFITVGPIPTYCVLLRVLTRNPHTPPLSCSLPSATPHLHSLPWCLVDALLPSLRQDAGRGCRGPDPVPDLGGRGRAVGRLQPGHERGGSTGRVDAQNPDSYVAAGLPGDFLPRGLPIVRLPLRRRGRHGLNRAGGTAGAGAPDHGDCVQLSSFQCCAA